MRVGCRTRVAALLLAGAAPWAHACIPSFTCSNDAECDVQPGGVCGDDGQCSYACPDGATSTTGCDGATTTAAATSAAETSGTTAAPSPGCEDGVLAPGDLCFGDVQTLAYGGKGLAVGDLDGDLDLDLVIPHKGGLVEFLNEGGDFPSYFPLTTSAEHFSAAIGTIDGDAAPDVIARDWYYLTYLRNNDTGTGAFTKAGSHAQCHGGGVRTLAVAELDGEAPSEILVQRAECPMGMDVGLTVGIYNLGQDGTSLVPAAVGNPPGMSQTATPMAVADVDGDGHPDVVVGNSIFLRPDAWSSPITLQPGGAVAHLAIAPLDGDALADVVMIVLNKVMIARHVNASPGEFTAPEPLALTGAFDSVAAADLDGDGLHDLVLGESADGANTLRVLRNMGYPGTAFAEQTVELGAGTKVADLAIADLDGDAALDIIASVNPDPGQTLVLLASP